MKDELPGAELSPDLALDEAELLVLTAFRLTMMDADIEAESSTRKAEIKRRDRDAEVLQAISRLRAVSETAPRWAVEFRDRVDIGSRDQVQAAFSGACVPLAAEITSRPRALMLLIDTVLFDPWTGKTSWNRRQRTKQLQSLVGAIPSLDSHDLNTIERECAASLREIQLRVTAIGDRYDAAVVRLPNVVGDALKSAVVWVKSLNADVIESAVRSEVITRLVVVEAECDDEKAKRVVQSIQERLAVVAEKQLVLTAKLQEMRNLNLLLSSENRELKKQLEAERERAQVAEAALQAALEHIFDKTALPAAVSDGDL